MTKGNTAARRGTLSTALAFAGAILLAACGGQQSVDSSSAALNYAGGGDGSGNKSFNLNGWEVVDSTHLNLYFSKQALAVDGRGEVDPSMFVVKASGGTNLVSDIDWDNTLSGTGYSGISASGLNKDTKVALVLSSALQAGTVYTVEISKFLTDDNGVSLSNYLPLKDSYSRADFTFTFTAPSCSGTPVTCTWSGTPAAPTYTVTASSSSNTREQNLVIIFDRPISTSGTTLTDFLAALNSTTTPAYSKGGTAVLALSPAESYQAYSNDAGGAYDNTTFVYPLTKSGSTTAVYNRTANSTYTLNVPTFTGVNGTTFDPAQISFTTLNGDIPGWLQDPPTVSNTYAGLTSGQLYVTWSATALDPTKVGATTGYHVYYKASGTDGGSTQDKYAEAYTRYGSTSNTYITLSGLNTSKWYFIRIVPYNDLGPAGFSSANATAVKPHL